MSPLGSKGDAERETDVDRHVATPYTLLSVAGLRRAV
jgi:hypothetical protein